MTDGSSSRTRIAFMVQPFLSWLFLAGDAAPFSPAAHCPPEGHAYEK